MRKLWINPSNHEALSVLVFIISFIKLRELPKWNSVLNDFATQILNKSNEDFDVTCCQSLATGLISHHLTLYIFMFYKKKKI